MKTISWSKSQFAAAQAEIVKIILQNNEVKHDMFHDIESGIWLRKYWVEKENQKIIQIECHQYKDTNISVQLKDNYLDELTNEQELNLLKFAQEKHKQDSKKDKAYWQSKSTKPVIDDDQIEKMKILIDLVSNQIK